MSAVKTTFAVREQQLRMAVNGPKLTQSVQRHLRKWHQTIFVTLGISDMNTLAIGVDIGNGQTQTLAKTQAQAVEGEKEDLVAENACGFHDQFGLSYRDDVGKPLSLGRFDQIDVDPGFSEYMLVKELEPIQIELDRTPRM